MIKEHLIELIDKYLSGTATDSERQLAEEYLKRLEANGNSTLNDQQAEEVKAAMWHQIQLQTTQHIAPIVMPWYRSKAVRSIAVAALIILMVGSGIFFFGANNHTSHTIVVRNDKPTGSVLFVVHREVNTTGMEKRIQLSDGSLIVLANKSEVTYRQPFVHERNITLVGKAYFNVAKEHAMPFTVISGAITTTALGTAFTVTAFKNAKQIVVRLYKGKVVVRPVDSGNKRLKKEVFLLPGQAFVYDAKTYAKVTTFKASDTVDNKGIMNEESEDYDPSLPPGIRGSWYMFNNQSLGEVFKQLEQMFDVTIVYNKKDAETIYFTRRYSRSDSLETILREISTLHNLKVIKKDNTFIINK